ARSLFATATIASSVRAPVDAAWSPSIESEADAGTRRRRCGNCHQAVPGQRFLDSCWLIDVGFLKIEHDMAIGVVQRSQRARRESRERRCGTRKERKEVVVGGQSC